GEPHRERQQPGAQPRALPQATQAAIGHVASVSSPAGRRSLTSPSRDGRISPNNGDAATRPPGGRLTGLMIMSKRDTPQVQAPEGQAGSGSRAARIVRDQETVLGSAAARRASLVAR